MLNRKDILRHKDINLYKRYKDINLVLVVAYESQSIEIYFQTIVCQKLFQQSDFYLKKLKN